MAMSHKEVKSFMLSKWWSVDLNRASLAWEPLAVSLLEEPHVASQQQFTGFPVVTPQLSDNNCILTYDRFVSLSLHVKFHPPMVLDLWIYWIAWLSEYLLLSRHQTASTASSVNSNMWIGAGELSAARIYRLFTVPAPGTRQIN